MAEERDDDLEAASYVLGTQDAGARRVFAARLEREKPLRALVDAWERRLAPLGQHPPEVPSPALKQRIEAAIDSLQDFPTVRGDEGVWRPLVPGIERKILHVDREKGYRSFLLRFAPGGVLPAHEHADDEECVMIEGEIFIAGVRLTAGDWQVAPKGRPHPPIASPRGGIVYIRAPIRRGAE